MGIYKLTSQGEVIELKLTPSRDKIYNRQKLVRELSSSVAYQQLVSEILSTSDYPNDGITKNNVISLESGDFKELDLLGSIENYEFFDDLYVIRSGSIYLWVRSLCELKGVIVGDSIELDVHRIPGRLPYVISRNLIKLLSRETGEPREN